MHKFLPPAQPLRGPYHGSYASGYQRECHRARDGTGDSPGSPEGCGACEAHVAVCVSPSRSHRAGRTQLEPPPRCRFCLHGDIPAHSHVGNSSVDS